LFPAASKGTIAGEGAAFFLLASEPSGNDYSRLEGVATFYKPDGAGETERHIRSFLTIQGIDPATIDLVITGANGDQPGDNIYHQLESSVFSGKPVIPYKHLCGEYPTSASFALWMAANIIKTGVLPAVLTNEGTVNEKFAGGTIKRILIYNHYLTIHHSLILLSA
jgi:3-oxoacyl-(acyl-carrier-protein) synthase